MIKNDVLLNEEIDPKLVSLAKLVMLPHSFYTVKWFQGIMLDHMLYLGLKAQVCISQTSQKLFVLNNFQDSWEIHTRP